MKRKIDEKDARLGKLEIHNKRMEEINCDLEKRVKVMTVAERKLQEEQQREHLMRKQIFETPRADVPYFGDFKEREGRLGYRCKKDCLIGGEKWVEFKKDYNITKRSQELHLAHLNKHVLELGQNSRR